MEFGINKGNKKGNKGSDGSESVKEIEMSVTFEEKLPFEV